MKYLSANYAMRSQFRSTKTGRLADPSFHMFDQHISIAQNHVNLVRYGLRSFTEVPCMHTKAEIQQRPQRWQKGKIGRKSARTWIRNGVRVQGNTLFSIRMYLVSWLQGGMYLDSTGLLSGAGI